ncbi:MAG: DUF3592 domain-containing protein [Anaerolineae bacterium]|nr:DUF3592 domain-containing protein [Anaerolineae bacterium]
MNNERLTELAQIILKDNDAARRMEALLEIRRSDHPRVTELLHHVSQKDRDAAVRDLAANLHLKRTLDAPASVEQIVTEAGITVRETTRTPGWTCAACGAVGNTSATCRYCGAERPAPDVMVQVNNTVTPAQVSALSHNMLKPALLVGKGCVLLFFLPFILVGICTLVWSINEVVNFRQLSDYGVVADGVIEGRRMSEGDETTSYLIAYRFDHNGITYRSEQSVDWALYNGVEAGVPIQVLYLPGNPGVSRLAGQNEPPTFLFIFAIIWNVFVWIMVVGWFYGLRRGSQAVSRIASSGKYTES